MILGLNCTQGRVLQDGMQQSMVKYDTVLKSARVCAWVPIPVATLQTIIPHIITTNRAIYMIRDSMCS